ETRSPSTEFAQIPSLTENGVTNWKRTQREESPNDFRLPAQETQSAHHHHRPGARSDALAGGLGRSQLDGAQSARRERVAVYACAVQYVRVFGEPCDLLHRSLPGPARREECVGVRRSQEHHPKPDADPSEPTAEYGDGHGSRRLSRRPQGQVPPLA